MKTVTRIGLGFVGVITAAALGSGIASADTNDAAYLVALGKAGISGDNQALISNGHLVCTKRQAGMLDDAIVGQLMVQTGLSYAQASYMDGAAEAAYCPVYAPGGAQDSGTVT